ncbi:nicotinate phosphoribosyltransferase [Amycolatopsis acidiphila]|uniref:Nicotinate phosphoribosyltransferase n=1 Tax=Amycolatopsis acidiphila TaxID=715473 RepID=A0A557ZYZ9_9PSEU|nr:nicotinate phosphoribosyltransferase [Amycolatopsis acidiphila]TVT17245.1 nicotinate phosphoribosyltransferase [Amycolatopsis acidiphila]UIJ62933.1 nicotinate phosphoribosyltransferase [Amycolatopsis acidiphila]GHG65147.1 nicotinate phosphoribosyltransferase [Amycolatopsis acidiphila]
MTATQTDLYAVRTAAGCLRRGMTEPATFSLFARRLPPQRGFLVSAGLVDCLGFLEGFRFEEGELTGLRESGGLAQSDVDALAGLRFDGDVWAAPEGCLVFADEPLLEVTAPLPQAQLVGTALLNTVSFQATVATKAARCRIAAGGAELVDFAARRTHGFDAATAVARVCAMVGFAGTSQVGAVQRFGLAPLSTMTHSYVQAFGDEQAAFRAYAHDFPDSVMFLVDTNDTLAGVRAAVEVAMALGLPDGGFGVRFAAGDLLLLAQETRKLLDEAGFVQARIMVSGGLDEYELARLTAAQAPIDSYGVGVKLGVSADAPPTETAYELVEYAGRPIAQHVPGKETLPGAKQVYRRASGDPDVLALRDEPSPKGCRPVLSQVMRAGRRLRGKHRLDEARDRFERDLLWLPRSARRLRNPEPVRVRVSEPLRELSERLGAGH